MQITRTIHKQAKANGKQSSSRNSRSESLPVEPDSSNAAGWRFAPLDKTSFEPLYAQIGSRLRDQIRSGQLRPNDPLPGEAELSRLFGVSRMTSRQALQGLTSESLAYRERGRGTFVSAPKVEKQIAHLLGFSAEMRLLGLRASTRLLIAESIPAAPPVAAMLQLRPAAPVLRLHRLRLASGEPIAIEEAWLPQAHFPGIETIDFGRHSLYDALRDRYKVIIGSARETIEARGATREQALLLGVGVRSSLLVVSRTLLDADEKPVELAHSLYRGDRYRAVLNIPAVDSFSHNVADHAFDFVKTRRTLPS